MGSPTSDTTGVPYTVPIAFQNPSGADVILRSSTNVEFRAHMHILANASQVFRDMFDIPTPAPTSPQDDQFSQDGLPVVAMAETHRTVEHLLQLCYGEEPALHDFAQARDTVAAMTKYEMDEKWGEWMRDTLVSFAEAEPWQLYAFALHLSRIASHAPRKMEECAREAARVTLRHRHEILQADLESPVEGIHAEDLARLLRYHKVCGIRLLEMMITGDLIVRTGTHWVFLQPCVNCPASEVHLIMLVDENEEKLYNTWWWAAYHERLKDAVHQWPCGNAIESTELWTDIVEDLRSTCTRCHEQAIREMPEFVTILSKEIDQAAAEVRLEIIPS